MFTLCFGRQTRMSDLGQYRPMQNTLRHILKSNFAWQANMRGDYRQNESIQLCNSVGPFYRFTVLLYYYESSSFGNIVILRQCRPSSAISSYFGNIVILRQYRHTSAISSYFGNVVILWQYHRYFATSSFGMTRSRRI